MRLKEEENDEEKEEEEEEKEEKDCATACDTFKLVNLKLVTRSTTFPFAY